MTGFESYGQGEGSIDSKRPQDCHSAWGRLRMVQQPDQSVRLGLLAEVGGFPGWQCIMWGGWALIGVSSWLPRPVECWAFRVPQAWLWGEAEATGHVHTFVTKAESQVAQGSPR